MKQNVRKLHNVLEEMATKKPSKTVSPGAKELGVLGVLSHSQCFLKQVRH